MGRKCGSTIDHGAWWLAASFAMDELTEKERLLGALPGNLPTTHSVRLLALRL